MESNTAPDLVIYSQIADSAPGALDNVGLIRVIDGANGNILLDKFGMFANDKIAETPPQFENFNGGAIDIVYGAENADTSAGANDDRGMVAGIDSSDGKTLFTNRGPFTNDKFGVVFLTPGNLGGSSTPDVIGTGPEADSAEGANDDVGMVRGVNGNGGATLYTVRGSFTNDQLGDRLINAGDLNGDNFPDFLATATMGDSSEGANDDIGYVRVISGANGAVLYDINGDFPGDMLGDQVAVIDDINSDGRPDIIVSSSTADSVAGSNDDKGLLRAINGNTGATLFSVRGPFTGDGLGNAIGLPGDINADGVPDVLVTGINGDSSEGANDDVGLVLGIDGSSGAVLFDLRGDGFQDRLGDNDGSAFRVSPFAFPGDLNNDGSDDFIVAASVADKPSAATSNEGMVRAFMIGQCLSDPNKTGPGQCGCGVADTDSDADGTADCIDECPSNPATAVAPCTTGTTDTCTSTDNTGSKAQLSSNLNIMNKRTKKLFKTLKKLVGATKKIKKKNRNAKKSKISGQAASDALPNTTVSCPATVSCTNADLTSTKSEILAASKKIRAAAKFFRKQIKRADSSKKKKANKLFKKVKNLYLENEALLAALPDTNSESCS